MRCPEEDKEPIENHSFIVSPCIVSSSNVCTLQECDNKETKAKIPLSTPELYEYSKVKQNTTYPDFTQTLNFLDSEEVESLKTKPEKLLRQITQIPSDLTYGK